MSRPLCLVSTQTKVCRKSLLPWFNHAVEPASDSYMACLERTVNEYTVQILQRCICSCPWVSIWHLGAEETPTQSWAEATQTSMSSMSWSNIIPTSFSFFFFFFLTPEGRGEKVYYCPTVVDNSRDAAWRLLIYGRCSDSTITRAVRGHTALRHFQLHAAGMIIISGDEDNDDEDDNDWVIV